MARARRRTGFYLHAIVCTFALAVQANAEEQAATAVPASAIQSSASERAPEMSDRRKGPRAAPRRHANARHKDAAPVTKTLLAGAKRTKLRSPAKPEAINTWLIFGFTEGADVGEKGDWTIFQDSVFRATRSASGLAAWDGAIGVGYSPSNRMVLYLTALPSFERFTDPAISPVGGGSATSHGSGVGAGLKYQFLRRDEAPVGVALQLSPYWQQFQGADSYNAFGSEFRLIVDRELVPGMWFAAVNLAYLPHHYAYSDGSSFRRTSFEVSGAVSRRVSGDLFLGAEVRHVSKYNGYFGNHLTGDALYLGPTLFTGIGEHGYFGIAWSAQIAGNQRDAATPSGVQDGLDRHQVRVKAGLSF